MTHRVQPNLQAVSLDRHDALGSFRRLGSIAATIAVALGTFLLQGSSSVASPVKTAAASGLRVPLAFEKNTGQTDPRLQFFSRGAGHSIYLGPTETVIAFGERGASETGHVPDASAVSSRVLRFAFLGANANADGRGIAALPGRMNYISGRDAARWTTGVPTFGKVQYSEIFPGIDVVFYGNQDLFEYDFIVAPGADPAAISFRVEGADRLQIDGGGDLVLFAGSGQFRQHRPVVYQTVDGRRRDVPGRFVIGESNVVSFALGPYDRSATLVIDPVLSLEYSSYLGDRKVDRAWSVAADAEGNAYIAGDTLAILRNVPAAGFQTNFGGGTKYGGDAFVAKLDVTGTNFVYFTYLGGDSLESANGIAVDATGAAYVTGFTISTNFPVFPATGALQPQIGGTNIAKFNVHHADAFVTKLDAAGLPVYSTYLGGEVADVGAAIAVHTNGCAYVTGYTDSALVFRVTNEVRTVTCTNFFLTNLVCGSEIIRTNVATARLLVASRVVTNSLRLQISNTDPATTNETTSIVTTTLLGAEKLTDGFPLVNALQTNNAGGADIFVAKLAADGASLVYSTYLGGVLSREFGTGIGIDAMGHAVISAVANEADFPVTNAIQSRFAGGRDAVVAKLAPDGSSLVYATYLGGSLNDVAYGLAVDADGSAYVVGSEASRDFMTTPGYVRRGGVSTSTDGGAHWALSSSGLTHTGVRALVINPVAPATLYAGTPRGVFISTDGGATWEPSSSDLSGLNVTAIAIDPNAPSTVYAAGTRAFYKSEDSGFSWTALGRGLPNADVRSIVFNPSDSTVIYAGTRLGFFVSTDGGTNFLYTGKGLRNRSINELAIDPWIQSLFYAATDGGVVKSTNSGLNWRAFNKGLATRRVFGVAVNPSSPDTVVAGTIKGVYRSIDAGTNWVLMTNGIGRPQVNALRFDPGDSSIVYAACTNGVFKSVDGGVNWTNASNGLIARDLVTLAIDPSDSMLIYAGARGTNFSGGTNDAFLVKLSPDGSTLDYGFTFGGTRTDEARAVAVDTNGSAFVTGLTLSRNFPVNGAVERWQGTNSGKTDVFVAQFDPSGSSNVFSIYLGGRRNDSGHGLALDGMGGIYVVGATDSRDFLVTNAVQQVRGGGKSDAFVTKILVTEPDPGPDESAIESALGRRPSASDDPVLTPRPLPPITR